MECSLETFTTKNYTIESPTAEVFVPDCAAACTGAKTRIEQRPLFFGKFGPLLDRTVKICPISQREFPSSLITDILKAGD